MANVRDTAVWHDVINQIESGEPILAKPVEANFADSNMNIAITQLAERCQWLKQQIEIKSNELTGLMQ